MVAISTENGVQLSWIKVLCFYLIKFTIEYLILINLCFASNITVSKRLVISVLVPQKVLLT